MDERTRGHGRHWACLYPDIEDFLTGRLPDLLHGARVMGTVAWQDEEGGGDLTALAEAEGDLRHLALLRGDGAGRFVWSGYPFAAIGVIHEVVLEEVLPWPPGVEGRLVVTTAGGVRLTFFDTLFFRNRDRYHRGGRYRFAFSGLAYGLEAGTGGADDLAPAGLLACRDRAPDDYHFAGAVHRVHPLRLRGQELAAVHTTLRHDEDADFDLVVYVAAHGCVGGRAPAAGGTVQGQMWLQGYLVDDGAPGGAS